MYTRIYFIAFLIKLALAQASTLREVSVHLGETVLDESGIIWHQMKGKVGGSGNVPVEGIFRKKSKDRGKFSGWWKSPGR